MSYASTNLAIQLGILQMGIGCAMNAFKKQSTILSIDYRNHYVVWAKSRGV